MQMKPLIHGITHNPRIDVLAVLRRLFAGPASGADVATFLDENFVPPAEVDVDTLVLKTRSGEWCVGLDDIAKIVGGKWEFIDGIDAGFAREVVSADGDTAWLDCEAEFLVKFRHGGFLGLWAKKIAETVKNPDGLILADIIERAEKIDTGLFEQDCGAKYAIFCRVSGILSRKGHPWRFQQIRLSFR